MEMSSNKCNSSTGKFGDLRVTTSTLVCLGFILWDIYHSFRRRLPWIPCRLFTLNSLTLTVLAISTKPSSDFITPMPRPTEQLAKLCGPVLLCISIGVLCPSIGSMNYYERSVNLASLAITVLNVIIATSLQIQRGSISMFVVEQVVVMVVLFLLLNMSWICSIDINSSMGHKAELFKIQLEKDKPDHRITQALENFHNNFEYYCNPQFQTLSRAHYVTVGILCSVCSALSLKAAIGVLASDEIIELSTLKWPKLMVLGTQILTIVVGGLVIGFRWLTLVSHMKPFDGELLKSKGYKFFASAWLNCIIYSLPWFSSVPYVMEKIFSFLAYAGFVLERVMYWLDQLVVYPIWKAKQYYCYFKNKNAPYMLEENNTSCFCNYNALDKWLLKKVEENHNKWIQIHTSKGPPMNLIQLLLKYPSTISRLPTINEKTDCCLLLAILARLDQFENSTGSLVVKVLDEVFEIIYFIVGNGSKFKSLTDELKSNLTDNSKMYAKDIWLSRGMKYHWFKEFIEPLRKWVNTNTSGRQEREELKQKQWIDDDVLDALKPQTSSSIPLEEHFVSVLALVLNQLPHTIFKYIVGSPHQELEERIQLSFKFLCKLNLQKAEIPWEGVGIVHLIPNQSSNTNRVQQTEQYL